MEKSRLFMILADSYIDFPWLIRTVLPFSLVNVLVLVAGPGRSIVSKQSPFTAKQWSSRHVLGVQRARPCKGASVNGIIRRHLQTMVHYKDIVSLG